MAPSSLGGRFTCDPKDIQDRQKLPALPPASQASLGFRRLVGPVCLAHWELEGTSCLLDGRRWSHTRFLQGHMGKGDPRSSMAGPQEDPSETWFQPQPALGPVTLRS
jgi:hypothetical protein